MPMQKKELRDVSANLRSSYQKALEVVRKNNVEYGIELLLGIVKKDPCFIEARQSLRKAEAEKASKMSGLAKFFANIKINKFTFKGRSLINKNPIEAMNCAENALAVYCNSAPALNLLAEAAIAAEAYFIAVESYEAIRANNPKNEANLRNLAQAYELDGNGVEVLKVRQQIAEMRPNDLQAQADVRGAAALATMQTSYSGTSALDNVRDSDEVRALEQSDHTARNIDDVLERIARLEKQVSDGDDSVDTRRRLAELYQRVDRHDDALASLHSLVEKMGTLDPLVDRCIEKSEVAKAKAAVVAFRQAGDEASAKEQEEAINQYRLERAEERAVNYPNDMQIRYDLACLYWEFKMIDKALEQFQLAQKNPQRRLSSIVYLGRCFHEKAQYDIAAEQFERALKEMLVMDKEKMHALYSLGLTCEALGKVEKAIDCFKQIYQANINYLDVAKRLEKFYKK